MNFEEHLNKNVKIVEKYMDEYLPSESKYPEVVYNSMRYSVFAGGKRLRPIMVMEACRALGGDALNTMPFACAIEMIHTYSLIHDDLPALDNDDYRRGRLTSHKVYGEDIAILTGDALLHHAFQTMAQAAVEKGDVKYTKAMLAIAEGSGAYGMVAGQVVDVISEGKPIDKYTLDFIHTNKTAAMIKASMKAGALIAGASEDVVEKLEKVGDLIGVAFQIQDDILDITSTFDKLGKPINSDARNEKTTYASLFGVEKASEIVEEMSNEAIDILKSIDADMNFFVELTNYLVRRDF